MTLTHTPSSKKSTTHTVYHVREDSDQSYWTRIGVTWEHKDQKGFNVQITIVPLDGWVVLRIAKEKNDGPDNYLA